MSEAFKQHHCPHYLGRLSLATLRAGNVDEKEVTIQVNDEQKRAVFPVSLIDRAEDFDALMGTFSESIEKG